MFKTTIFYLLTIFMISGCHREMSRLPMYSIREVLPTVLDVDTDLDVTVEELGNVVVARIELIYGLDDLLANLKNVDGSLEPHFHWHSILRFATPLEIVQNDPIIRPIGTRHQPRKWIGYSVGYEIGDLFPDETDGRVFFETSKTASAMVIDIFVKGDSFGRWVWVSEDKARVLMTRFFNEWMIMYPSDDRLVGDFGKTIVYYYKDEQ